MKKKLLHIVRNRVAMMMTRCLLCVIELSTAVC